MPKAVIFDMDGTLIDTVDLHARSWADTFRHFGHSIPAEAVRGQIGKGGDQLLPVFLDPEEIERRGKEMEDFRSELFKRRYLPQARAFPGVRALFERIRREGARTALASSAKADELDGYLTLAGVGDLVDATTSSDDAERSKPHPDIFEAALEKLGDVAPKEAVVVGDSPFDAEAAAKAGLPTVGLLCGGFPEADLRAAGCVAIFRDPQDLLQRFDQSPLAGGRDLAA